MLRQTSQRASRLLSRRQFYYNHGRQQQLQQRSSSSSFSTEQSWAPVLVIAAAVLAQQQQQKQEQQHDGHYKGRETTSKSSLSSGYYHATTKCELLSMPRWSLFQSTMDSRQKTLEYLTRNANQKDALTEKYDMTNFEQSIIGIGSFGAVGRATCRATGEHVAIKKLPKDLTSDAAVQRELQALVQIRQAGGHPNLNTFREHFHVEHDDAYYLVMDLVEGGELFDALCRTGPMCEADAARFVRQLASALQFLHALELVHADLKPENLLLSQHDAGAASVKLVDFGCCRPSSESRAGQKKNSSRDEAPDGSTRVNVTPEYCPPEVLADLQKAQALDEDMNPDFTSSYDMWSLGVILFVMLVGAHPFDLKGNATDEEIAHNVLQSRLVTKTPEWKKYVTDFCID